MIGRLIGICALVSSLAGSAWAQSDKLVIVRGRTAEDVETAIGMKPGTSPPVNNADKLALSMAASDQLVPLYFKGQVWSFDKTAVADFTGRSFSGNGIAKQDSNETFNFLNGTPSKIVWSGGVVPFDGTSITASTSGASATVEVTGYDVEDEDLLHTVEIKTGSGANFTQGRYHIISVNEGANTWTLDRVCSTGTETVLVGTKKGTLWRDQGFGNTYQGLNFRGTPAHAGTPHPDTRAAILFQIRSWVSGVTPPTGKGAIRDCGFADADVGIMFGKGLAQFLASTPAQDYDGKADNNSDHTLIEKVDFQEVDTCVLQRTAQSVAITGLDWAFHTGAAKTAGLYVERGGKISIRGMYFSSGFANGPVVCRIGSSGGAVASSPASPITLEHVILDAPSPSMKLLEIDGGGNTSGEITFRGCANQRQQRRNEHHVRRHRKSGDRKLRIGDDHDVGQQPLRGGRSRRSGQPVDNYGRDKLHPRNLQRQFGRRGFGNLDARPTLHDWRWRWVRNGRSHGQGAVQSPDSHRQRWLARNARWRRPNQSGLDPAHRCGLALQALDHAPQLHPEHRSRRIPDARRGDRQDRIGRWPRGSLRGLHDRVPQTKVLPRRRVRSWRRLDHSRRESRQHNDCGD